MKLIKPSFEIIPQENGKEGINKHIEIAGRTCYKSENLITNETAKPFITGILKTGHESVTEHANVIFTMLIQTKTAKYLK